MFRPSCRPRCRMGCGRVTVRKTVDLDHAVNARLTHWQVTAASSLGRSRVTFQDVASTLIDELLADGDFADRLTARLREANHPTAVDQLSTTIAARSKPHHGSGPSLLDSKPTLSTFTSRRFYT